MLATKSIVGIIFWCKQIHSINSQWYLCIIWENKASILHSVLFEVGVIVENIYRCLESNILAFVNNGNCVVDIYLVSSEDCPSLFFFIRFCIFLCASGLSSFTCIKPCFNLQPSGNVSHLVNSGTCLSHNSWFVMEEVSQCADHLR